MGEGNTQLTPKQEIIFSQRKRRYFREIVEQLQHISKSKNPRQTSFQIIREKLTELEILHSDTGKSWLTAEDVFWNKYNVDHFIESTGVCTKAHLQQCRNGHKSYSERLKEAIVNYIKTSDL